jgi:hypothetical protein
MSLHVHRAPMQYFSWQEAAVSRRAAGFTSVLLPPPSVSRCPGESSGNRAIVDLEWDNDQDLDPIRAVVGLNATPLIVDASDGCRRRRLPGGSFDPATNRLYMDSHTMVYTLKNVPAELATPGPHIR